MKKANQNKFIDETKIVSANIYEKDGKFKCAIAMDTVNKEEAVIHSDAYGTRTDVENFILSLK